MPLRFILVLSAVALAVFGAFLLFRTNAPSPAIPDAPRGSVASTPVASTPSPPTPTAIAPPSVSAPPPRPASAATDSSPASSDADLARIESAVASGQAASLPTLAPYLVHSDPALREAAREGMLQMSLAEAAPLLREAAGKIKDPREAILLLDAADFLSLPTIPVAAGAPRRTPVPPPPQRERPPPTASKSPLRP